MTWDGDETFTDALGDPRYPVTFSVNDNADGKHIIVGVNGDDGNGNPDASMVIALTANDTYDLIDLLQTLVEGLD